MRVCVQAMKAVLTHKLDTLQAAELGAAAAAATDAARRGTGAGAAAAAGASAAAAKDASH